MRLRIIAPLEYFAIENNGQFKYLNFTITSGSVLGRQLAKDKKFLNTFGSHKVDLIKKSYVFVAEMKSPGIPHIEVDEFAEKMLSHY